VAGDRQSDDEGTVHPEDTIDRLSAWIQAKGLAVPAMFLLEVGKPLALIGSQLFYLFQPLMGFPLGGGLDERTADRYAAFLEDPANVERLLRRLEDGEASGSSTAVGRDRGR
jgi:hypothetical protein